MAASILYRPSLKTSKCQRLPKCQAVRCGAVRGGSSRFPGCLNGSTAPQIPSEQLPQISLCAAAAVFNLFCLNKKQTPPFSSPRRRLPPDVIQTRGRVSSRLLLCSLTAELRRCAGTLSTPPPPLEWNSNLKECLLFTAARMFLFSHLRAFNGR